MRATVSEIGPLLLVAPARSQRHAGRRAQRRLQGRRRRGPAAPRPQGPAGDAAMVGEEAPRLDDQLRQRVAKATIGAIQRALLVLEQQGARAVLRRAGARTSTDLMRTTPDGRGVINILAADKLMQSPRALRDVPAVAAVGAVRGAARGRRPRRSRKLVFFFDEAHLLFDDAPKALLDKIEQVVRLIRSKGVGVYFVTQNPLDVPGDRARPARQPRAACAACLHAARPEGGEGGGGDVPAEPGVLRPRRRSPSSASARRWSRCSSDKGVPAVVERTLIRPPSSRARHDHATTSARKSSPRARSAANTTRRWTASRPSRCCPRGLRQR